MTIQLGDSEYRKLARRFAELELKRGLSTLEQDEYHRIGYLMTRAELFHGKGAIEAVVDDYDFAVGQCGSLGGVELS